MPAKPSETIAIQALDRRKVLVTIVGETPLIVNRMSAKARHTLMLGGRRKSAAERLELKHHPIEEFRESMYIEPDAEGPVVQFPVIAFKSAMATAALVTPGMKKTDVQRLVYIPSEFCPIYGVPTLRMDIVRSSDMNRTPDVRTRAMFREWATQFELEFVAPALAMTGITTLLNNAGIVAGVGENQQDVGKGSFGTFQVADDIPESILNCRDAQEVALGSPEPANRESAELLQEYANAVARQQ